MAEDRGDSSRPCTSVSSPSHKAPEIHRVGQRKKKNRDGNMDSNTNSSQRLTYITSADLVMGTMEIKAEKMICPQKCASIQRQTIRNPLEN